ncbi:3-carboxy-cis,cis-muconate cycloisomerase [Pacificibacter maritimus]|uniref:3-carboxy-cis,cis-muconate cycloisomerase n=1 Tax=Pacificibacter maritimus TaxID=762213 RepID=A0A3N4UEY1_9RHOB|nr:3-carboxy-cis,cis-muconate cycloisomerase [Pacificibacter maritimus]RPE67015.1 3-carboxy-cis,cis-muconate cycloisomerase [Pacificibacter maritimus]
MTLSAFDHPWLSGLFEDKPMADIWSADKQMAHMQSFEAAWSRALGKHVVGDETIGETAARAIESMNVDLGDIRAGLAIDGVPIPRMVGQMKAAAGDDAVSAGVVHKGATSQDVVDSALALTLRDTSMLIAGRMMELETALKALEAQFGDRPMMGRTRMQAATEITVADRVQAWRIPLAAHLTRLDQLRPRVELVQIGGASGDRKALGEAANAVVTDVAADLGLTATHKAWHAMRDGIAEYASFLSLVSGTLGKIGQDICLMAQQGIDEVRMSGGGGSSAMPHKQNPVLAELLVTLARFNAVQVSGMHHALLHEQERSGAAWSLEWMLLPQMAQTTGRGLSAAIDLCARIERLGAAD